MKSLVEYYREERRRGYRSLPALRIARTKMRWNIAGGGIVALDDNGNEYSSTIDTPVEGSVRLAIAIDIYAGDWIVDFDCCETVGVQHRKCQHESEGRRCPNNADCWHKCDRIERANRDGVYGIVAQYRNCYLEPDKWITVDSIWGFIGMDWKDSGYDIDMMYSALEAQRSNDG